LRLLAERLVGLQVVESVSYQTVRQALQQPAHAVADPALVHPPEQDAEFVWRMEDVLGVCTRPDAPRRPRVCLDEPSRQLLGQVTLPRPVVPGRPARQDSESQRGRVGNLFLVAEPLAGWRHVTGSDRRTPIDWAHCHQGPGRRPRPGCRADRARPRQPQHPTPASL
jgi:hypothetical protein